MILLLAFLHLNTPTLTPSAEAPQLLGPRLTPSWLRSLYLFPQEFCLNWSRCAELPARIRHGLWGRVLLWAQELQAWACPAWASSLSGAVTAWLPPSLYFFYFFFSSLPSLPVTEWQQGLTAPQRAGRGDKGMSCLSMEAHDSACGRRALPWASHFVDACRTVSAEIFQLLF